MAASFSRSPRSASGVFITWRRRDSSATGFPLRGSITSRATSFISCCSPCDPPAFSQPLPVPSVLMYTAALSRSSAACFSAHSVEPSSPHSSPSHNARMTVRFGRQPAFSNSARPRPVSISDTAPLTGSSAPFTHASWWLPKITHSSGNVDPSMRTMTL
jgi:hypothetical protein